MGIELRWNDCLNEAFMNLEYCKGKQKLVKDGSVSNFGDLKAPSGNEKRNGELIYLELCEFEPVHPSICSVGIQQNILLNTYRCVSLSSSKSSRA